MFGIGSIFRQETYRVYESLRVVAGIQIIIITAVIVVLFRWLEGKATV